MKAKISLITIWTDQIHKMKAFYKEVLGFEVSNDLGSYVEFVNEGVRFAICQREIMYTYSEAFKEECRGQAFELAFPCESLEDVNQTYTYLINHGATPIQAPDNMPWHQRTALFADPDGNIHEIFTDL